MGRRIGVLANGEEATGPKSSGLELAVVARSPPARTQYAPDSRAGEIAPIRSVDPRTTCAHVRLHRLCFLGVDHVLSISSPLFLPVSRPIPAPGDPFRDHLHVFPAGIGKERRVSSRFDSMLRSLQKDYKGVKITGPSGGGRTVIIINDPRLC